MEQNEASIKIKGFALNDDEKICSPGPDTRVCSLRSDNHEVINNGTISICSLSL